LLLQRRRSFSDLRQHLRREWGKAEIRLLRRARLDQVRGNVKRIDEVLLGKRALPWESGRDFFLGVLKKRSDLRALIDDVAKARGRGGGGVGQLLEWWDLGESRSKKRFGCLEESFLFSRKENVGHGVDINHRSRYGCLGPFNVSGGLDVLLLRRRRRRRRRGIAWRCLKTGPVLVVPPVIALFFFFFFFFLLSLLESGAIVRGGSLKKICCSCSVLSIILMGCLLSLSVWPNWGHAPRGVWWGPNIGGELLIPGLLMGCLLSLLVRPNWGYAPWGVWWGPKIGGGLLILGCLLGCLLLHLHLFFFLFFFFFSSSSSSVELLGCSCW